MAVCVVKDPVKVRHPQGFGVILKAGDEWPDDVARAIAKEYKSSKFFRFDQPAKKQRATSRKKVEQATAAPGEQKDL